MLCPLFQHVLSTQLKYDGETTRIGFDPPQLNPGPNRSAYGTVWTNTKLHTKIKKNITTRTDSNKEGGDSGEIGRHRGPNLVSALWSPICKARNFLFPNRFDPSYD
ncbi:hypothetical protein CK203_064313 [Vitis vinifera]|uniref:Uncharacterized protein n=1 Tax=Vitis vinifera TaxID=29760 RepID=A0A438G7I3_VITVI|nr:hypothetical protein CK203_064313 [Vitis vinifera]